MSGWRTPQRAAYGYAYRQTIGDNRPNVGNGQVQKHTASRRRQPNGDLVKRRSATHAAMRADELLDQGDMDGRAAWLRVLEAVTVLLAQEPEGTVH